MENNPTFKQLKITEPNGTTKLVPLNHTTKQHYTEHVRWLSKEKQQKYKVEEVTLTLDEAVEVGISEAIQIKFPPKKKQNQNNDFVATLVEQNKMLMQLLANQQEQSKPSKK